MNATPVIWDRIVEHAEMNPTPREHIIYGGSEQYYCAPCNLLFTLEHGNVTVEFVPQ